MNEDKNIQEAKKQFLTLEEAKQLSISKIDKWREKDNLDSTSYSE